MMIRTLWQKTAKYLVLVENGNEEGYRTIVNARHLVLLDENKGLSAVNVEDRAGGDVNGAKFDHSAHVVAPVCVYLYDYGICDIYGNLCNEFDG
jgi:ribosomal protein RSM22 (predicted rRNA methylase)